MKVERMNYFLTFLHVLNLRYGADIQKLNHLLQDWL